jgi:N-acetylmuramoyl-L-alanine amidase
LILFAPGLRAQEKPFTIVIDAGHGGKDTGAPGPTINEKVINLSVALKFGNLISENMRNVKVVYTRKTDRFIELDERANIANRNKADLFISIHTNATEKGSSTVAGTETYTLGLARSEENLEVAMRENSAILLEDNYQQKYEGFDPNSTESYIMFEFMQNKHMTQSIKLASEIQKAFKTAKRNDRGVRQSGLLVLRRISMPGVLVELGFINNPLEEKYLKSADGQNKLAKALYDAFVRYKRDVESKQQETALKQPPAAEKKENTTPASAATPPTAGTATTGKPKPPASAKPSSKGIVVYKIQILTSKKKLPANAKQFKGYKKVTYYEENGLYKYTYGESPDWASIKATHKKILKDFKDSFIVAFKDGKRVKE